MWHSLNRRVDCSTEIVNCSWFLLRQNDCQPSNCLFTLSVECGEHSEGFYNRRLHVGSWKTLEYYIKVFAFILLPLVGKWGLHVWWASSMILLSRSPHRTSCSHSLNLSPVIEEVCLSDEVVPWLYYLDISEYFLIGSACRTWITACTRLSYPVCCLKLLKTIIFLPRMMFSSFFLFNKWINSLVWWFLTKPFQRLNLAEYRRMDTLIISLDIMYCSIKSMLSRSPNVI